MAEVRRNTARVLRRHTLRSKATLRPQYSATLRDMTYPLGRKGDIYPKSLTRKAGLVSISSAAKVMDNTMASGVMFGASPW